MRITVIGCGYLGATHAAAMAELGHEVLGMEIDPVKREQLARGEVPMYEPDLGELMQRAVGSGRLRFTDSYAEVAAFGEIHFVCVGTPQQQQGLGADVSQVENAVEGLAPHLDATTLVVGKSTVPVGTAQRMSARLTELAPAGAEAMLAWNPEFLREGFAVRDTMRPDRIVIGVSDPRAEKLLRDFYAPMIDSGSPVVVTDYATAELVKVAANSFLATKISFINAMAEVCEAAGADVQALATAIGHDDRIGPKFLGAGLGFGGGCLPKDIRAFMARAGELGADQALTFLREVDAINMRRRTRMVDLARDVLQGSFLGRKVAVLGAAFKPESDDIRDSPALNVAAQIRLQGGDVVVTDPAALENARRAWPQLHYEDKAEVACTGADVVLLLTEWDQYRQLDPAMLADIVRQRNMLDGRNALDPVRWRAAGWTYRALGRPRV
jgi:UDPglucose 6-dehydrogenase